MVEFNLLKKMEKVPKILTLDEVGQFFIEAKILNEIGIEKDIVFHTLRACFATHLLASGAEAAKVMQIGGWKDFKTFQIYIRLAGVSVKGVTDSLNLLPDVNLGHVVSLCNR